MITDEEFLKKIDEVSTSFVGQIDDLDVAIGMLISGRLYGWRVIRLVHSKRHWNFACKLFGDLKELLPERGRLANKSVGLSLIDKSSDYWDVVAGNVSRDFLPLHKRKMAS